MKMQKVNSNQNGYSAMHLEEIPEHSGSLGVRQVREIEEEDQDRICDSPCGVIACGVVAATFAFWVLQAYQYMPLGS